MQTQRQKRSALRVLRVLLIVTGLSLSAECCASASFSWEGIKVSGSIKIGVSNDCEHVCDCESGEGGEGDGGGGAGAMVQAEATYLDEFGVAHCARCNKICFDKSEPPHDEFHMLVGPETLPSDPHEDALPCGEMIFNPETGLEEFRQHEHPHWWRCSRQTWDPDTGEPLYVTDPETGEQVLMDCGLRRWYALYAEPALPTLSGPSVALLVLLLATGGLLTARTIAKGRKGRIGR